MANTQKIKTKVTLQSRKYITKAPDQESTDIAGRQNENPDLISS